MQSLQPNPKRRSDPPPVSDRPQPRDGDRAAIRYLPRLNGSRRKADDGERELVPMSWGFVLLQPGKAPAPRDERPRRQDFDLEVLEAAVRAATLPRSGIELLRAQHRQACEVVLVHRHRRRRPSPVRVPGEWQRWKVPVKKDGPNVEIDVYSFMTTEPNALTVSINHERMPVLLSKMPS